MVAAGANSRNVPEPPRDSKLLEGSHISFVPNSSYPDALPQQWTISTSSINILREYDRVCDAPDLFSFDFMDKVYYKHFSKSGEFGSSSTKLEGFPSSTSSG
ncbi:hypothetical protein CB1_001408023 [Camelus ferus]|nr:hypothetical protein CB1_001408023 [Camelus ferus]